MNDLVSRAKHGDQLAIDQLCRWFAKSFGGYAAGFASSFWFSYEDLLQEAQIALITQWIPRFDPDRGMAWTRFVEHYFKFFCRDFARSARHHQDCRFTKRSGDRLEREPLKMLELLCQHVNETDQREGFEHLLRGLSKQTKQIIRWYYVDGFTMKEIGGVLGLSEPRVSQIHRQAIEHMRRVLSEEMGPTANGRAEKQQTVAHGEAG